MADDALTVGELGRMVGGLRADLQTMAAGINSRLDRVVSTDVYAIQSAHVDQRLADLAREAQAAHAECRKLEDALDAHKKALDDYKLAEAARRERERQTRLYQLIVPILIALLSAAIAVWAVTAR